MRRFILGFTPKHTRRCSLNQIRARRAAVADAREIAQFWTVAEVLSFWGRSIYAVRPPACVLRKKEAN